jgi:putative methyltransferase (TIGR04325 family)
VSPDPLREVRAAARRLVPPLALDALREVRRRARKLPREWEAVPEGWRALQTDPTLRGWDVAAVGESNRRHFAAMRAALEGPLPLAFAPEHIPDGRLAGAAAGEVDVLLHNTVLGFAYALARAARQPAARPPGALSLLDWGGGVGHYALVCRALFPDLAVRYHCKDVPATVAVGRTLLPEVEFFADDACFERRFDFVFASCSLHYSQDWSAVLGRLARASSGYLLVTQVPVVHRAPSFVFVQRAHRYGYDTAYLGWCLQRAELLRAAAGHGLRLERELLNGFKPPVHGAPEPPEYRGFLFRAP